MFCSFCPWGLVVALLISFPVSLHGGTILLSDHGFWNTGVDDNRQLLATTSGSFDSHWKGSRVAGTEGWEAGDSTVTGGYAVGNNFNVAPVLPMVPNPPGNTQTPPWVDENVSTDSRWISPETFRRPDGMAMLSNDPDVAHNASVWEYSLDVNNPATAGNQLLITGRWASDNDVYLFVNGIDTGIKRERADAGNGNSVVTFDSFADFAIPSQFFQLGPNTLTFRVRNGVPAVGGLSADFGIDKKSSTGLRVEFLAGSIEPIPEPSSMLISGVLSVGSFVFRRGKPCWRV